MRISRINPLWFLNIYLLLNLYKPLLGLLLGREIITAISIVISLSLCIAFFAKDVLHATIKKKKIFSGVLLVIFTLHFFISITVLRTAAIYPALVSYFQITTPILFLFVIESLEPKLLSKLTNFLVLCLVPFILFAFIEIALPISIRTNIYMGFSRLTTGESNIDVAYYLGDTEYGGLRLGSLFFEPLTFAFVSSFFTIYLFSRKSKKGYITLVSNVLSLGKLPIATTFISLGSFFFKRLYKLYFTFVFLLIAFVLVYFVKNAQSIALESPSLGSHMLGLAYGLFNALEAPILGHGFGTAGYLSYVYYLKIQEDGPFKQGLGGLMNGNESAVGAIAYQLGYVLLLLFLAFFIVYFLRLVKARQLMMASGVLGFILSMFLSESVLSITVISVLLIFSKSLIVESESGISFNN